MKSRRSSSIMLLLRARFFSRSIFCWVRSSAVSSPAENTHTHTNTLITSKLFQPTQSQQQQSILHGAQRNQHSSWYGLGIAALWLLAFPREGSPTLSSESLSLSFNPTPLPNTHSTHSPYTLHTLHPPTQQSSYSDLNGRLSCGSSRLVALGIFGALTKLKSAQMISPTLARWRWAYLGSAMLKPAKLLINKSEAQAPEGRKECIFTRSAESTTEKEVTAQD